MNRTFLLALPTLVALFASGISAKPSHLKWMAGPPGLPAGSTFAVVSGDPSKEGMFTVRIKVPANYVVAPHHHPTDEKVSVLSGKLAYGMGDMLNRDTTDSIDPGYHVTLQAGMNHWVFTRESPAMIQVSAMGPFVITYVNPKDDPRNK
jgi:hypothetical protein